MNRILQRILAGQGQPADLVALQDLPAAIMGKTICALGDAASMPVLGFVTKFKPEFEYFIEHGRSMHDGRLTVAEALA
jgi:NADH-quinone oxidoreductase subunit F